MEKILKAKQYLSALAVMSLMLSASLSWGHASAKKTIPENDAVLSESPTELAVDFGAPAKLLSLTVAAESMDPIKIDISNATAVDGWVNVDIEPLLPNTYKVSWRAMGLDGHITAGEFTFTVSSSN